MPAVRQRIAQNDFSAGVFRDVAPALIPKQGVYDFINALLDEDGNPYRRGGSSYESTSGLGSDGLTWVENLYLRPGNRTVFANAADFGVLDAEGGAVNLGGSGLEEPMQSATLEDLLFIGGAALYGGSQKSSAYSTGTISVTNGSKTVTGSGVTWNTLVDAGMLFQTGIERVYVVDSIDSSSTLTLRDAYQGGTKSGQTYTLSPLHTIGSDPYEAADYYTSCANRIVALKGRTIKFTEIDDPHTMTNSHGTTNSHTLPAGVEGIGLATAGQTCIVFTTDGIWALEGLALDIVDANGNPQHRLQQLAGDTVLAGAAGLAAWGQRLIVPCVDGIYLMDGVSAPDRISRPIDRLYAERIAGGYSPGGAVVYEGHYFLPIIEGPDRVRELLVCNLPASTRSGGQTIFPWTRFTGDGGEIRCFAVHTSTASREPVLLGAQAREPSRVVDCSSYFHPQDAYASDADGSTHNFQMISRDVETGEETENVIRALRLRYELYGKPGEEAELRAAYSDGTLERGGAEWGEVEWGAFDWAPDDVGASFNSLSPLGESDGRSFGWMAVNKRERYGRFLIETEGVVSSFSLRALEMDVRPSGAQRR
jgi:hypothetical protein